MFSFFGKKGIDNNNNNNDQGRNKIWDILSDKKMSFADKKEFTNELMSKKPEEFIKIVDTIPDLSFLVNDGVSSLGREIMLHVLNNPVLTQHFIASQVKKNKMIAEFPFYADAIEKRSRDLDVEKKFNKDEIVMQFPVTNLKKSGNQSNLNLSNTCILFDEHMEMVLYKEGGYYAMGKEGGVKFGEANEGAHFSTNATKNRACALMLAVKALQVYKARKEGDKEKDFIMVELSGGNGKLSNDILNLIYKLANLANADPAWKELYSCLKFTTYEISPGLANEQMNRNEKYVIEGKFNVINKSADEVREQERMDICVSNELFDMLQWNDFMKADDGYLKVKVCIPSVSSEVFEQLSSEAQERCKKAYQDLPDDLKDAVDQNFNFIDKAALEELRKFQQQSSDGKSLLKLMHEELKWNAAYVDVGHFPHLCDFIRENKKYFDQLTPNEEHHVSELLVKTGTALQQVPTCLGIHMDYCVAVSGGTHREPRVYGEGIGDKASHYEFQPNVDITYDPDFGLLTNLCLRENNTVEDNAVFCHQGLLVHPSGNQELYDAISALPEEEQNELKKAVCDFAYCKQGFNFTAYSHDGNVKRFVHEEGFTIGRVHTVRGDKFYGDDEVKYVHEIREDVKKEALNKEQTLAGIKTMNRY